MISESLLFFKTINNVLHRSTYIQGIPNYNNPTETAFRPTADGINFQNLKNPSQFYFFLDRKDIIKVSVEDQSTIENRIGFKRLLLVGIFALAWKKKKTNPLTFLIFEYKNDVGLDDEIYFQTESKNGSQFYNNVRYNLYKYWKECDEHPENIEIWEKATSEKVISNKSEVAKNSKNGCLIFIVLVVVLAIFVKMCSGGSDKKENADSNVQNIAAVDSANASGDEATILAQHVIPIKNSDDEIRNAYQILKSKEYYTDTEIMRFNGLAKKFKDSKYQDRLKKTADSLSKVLEKSMKPSASDIATITKNEASVRKEYQETLHNAFLDNNLDIKVKVYGKNNKTIKLTYILFNDVWTRKFETGDYLSQIRAQGFTRIYISDGYDYTRYWTYED